MKNIRDRILIEIKEFRIHILLGSGIVLTSYLTLLLLSDRFIFKLWMEDGLFEYLTALFFLASAAVFMLLFIRKKHWIYLLFAFVFFFGAGEEISWGQRIIGFETPDRIEELNVQKEFTLHNLIFFQSHIVDGEKVGGTGFGNINTLFNLFWLVYCVFLPILLIRIGLVARLVERLHIPVPYMILGLLFPLNYMLFRLFIVIIPQPETATVSLVNAIDEIPEFCAAVLFFLLSLMFMKAFRKSRIPDPDKPALQTSAPV